MVYSIGKSEIIRFFIVSFYTQTQFYYDLEKSTDLRPVKELDRTKYQLKIVFQNRLGSLKSTIDCNSTITNQMSIDNHHVHILIK